MKTKSLFLKMALAAAVLAGVSQRSDAQSNVYSLNVVGYIVVYPTSGYSFLANQLSNSNNWLATLIPTAPLGTEVYLWDDQGQSFLPPSVYAEDGLGSTNWTVPDYLLTLGKGFVIRSPSRWTNVFVGEVAQGTLTTPIPGNHRFSLVASQVPQSLPLLGTTTGLSFPEIDGATVYFFNESTQAYSDAYTHCSGYGFFDPNHLIPTAGPSPMVPQCFFVQNPGPNTSWIRNFVVQRPAAPFKSVSFLPIAPLLSGITVRGGMVTLNFSGGRPCDVECSTNEVTWLPVAMNQTSPWTGPCPGSNQVFYRLVTH